MTSCICTQEVSGVHRFEFTTNMRLSCFLHCPSFMKTHQKCLFYPESIWGIILYFMLFHLVGKKNPESSLEQSYPLSWNKWTWKKQAKQNRKWSWQITPLVLDLWLNFSLDPFLNFHNIGPEPFIVWAHGQVTRNSWICSMVLF